MHQNNIVFEGASTKGTAFIIRYPTGNDLVAMTEYINTLSKEQTFVRFQGEIITEEDEAAYLQDCLTKIVNRQCVKLIVTVDNKFVGTADITLRDKVERHIGDFGISLLKDYRQEGIGTRLMELTIAEAKSHLIGLRIIVLSLFANNPLAHSMYRKFGFQEFGQLPDGVFYKSDYIDHIYMYKAVA